MIVVLAGRGMVLGLLMSEISVLGLVGRVLARVESRRSAMGAECIIGVSEGKGLGAVSVSSLRVEQRMGLGRWWY